MTTKKKSATKKTRQKVAAKKSATSARTKASDAVDDQLARYRSMRDFNITGEPSGAPKSKTKSTGLPFVIQKHAASHLHYDFRLGWNGVLKSWAISKGPSYVVKDKRLAVQVEDHPMEYGGFEGVIPKGQYGGGTVMVWDQGRWEPQPGHTDVDEGLRIGSLKFIMHGQRMKGKWALIRMKGKFANENKPNWLLIKEHDEFEEPEDSTPVTGEFTTSVVTGRTMEQIAASEDHVWHSKDTATGKAWQRIDKEKADQPPTRSPTPIPATRTKPAQPPAGTPKEKLPAFIPPQLALQTTTPPATAGWLHELKLDGYRIQAHKSGPHAQLLTRKGLDWTHRMKGIATQVSILPCESAIFDGEVVVLDAEGNTSFAALQAAFQEGANKALTYFIFDLLHLNGHNLRNLPLVERKAVLATLLANSSDTIHLSEHIESDGPAVFKKACELHAEGIISKRAAGAYISGRTSDWLKAKCLLEQEFVIGAFTLPGKGHTGIHGIGALSLGYYRDGKLIYAGRVGTGFTQKTHAILRTKLDKHRETENPFFKPPDEARRGVIPVKPQLVAQVQFTTWTADKLVRQASFKGLREDKPATEVRLEQALPLAETQQAHHTTAAPVAAKTHAFSSKKSATKTLAKTPKKSATKSTPIEHAPIRLTHPDKIIDAESHLTKQQLADYYWAIAPYMLPSIADRPLSIVRCPDGTAHQCFFQKHVTHTLPDGIGSVDVADKKGKVEPYITLSTQQALAGLAQIGVLEIHPWGSTNENLEHPDRIIIDLDPDTAIQWGTLAAAALDVRANLKKLRLESFLKSTGGKGLHIVVPIEPKYDWPTVKTFAHNFALSMQKQQPSLYLTVMTKSARANRIFIDYLRNQREATAIAAFSPRARPGMQVSMPLAWSELKLPDRPIFQVANFADWQARLRKDPWKDLATTHQQLPAT